MTIKIDAFKLWSETRSTPPDEIARPVATFDVVFDNGRLRGFWLCQDREEWFLRPPDGSHWELPPLVLELAVNEFMRIAQSGR